MSIVKWERKRYVCIKNNYTGEGVIVDMFQVRYELLKQRIFAFAQVMQRYMLTHKTRMVMIGLTYANVEDYSPGHIREYMKDLKRRLGKKLLGFAWVAEMQKRGAVHYHIIVVVEKGSRIPYPDKSGMWVHGSSNMTSARTPFYLVTYVGKEHQKDLGRYPKGCRLYSVSVRIPEGKYAHDYKVLAGLEKQAKIEKVARDYVMKSEGWVVKPESDWAYAGSSVTHGFAKEILLAGSEVK